MNSEERVKVKKASFVVVFKELLGMNDQSEELSEEEKRQIESLNLENDNIKVLEAELVHGNNSSKKGGGFSSSLKVNTKNERKDLNSKRKKERNEELIK